MTVLLSFLAFTGLVAGLTWFLTHKDDHGTSEGFFLAGRRLGPIVIAGSLLLTNLSTEQLVGLNGDAFIGGLHVMVWEIVTVLAIVLMALFFLPRFLRSGVTTVPQFLEDRYGPSTRTLTTLVFLVAYAVVLLPMILYTGAQALSEMFDFKSLTGIKNTNTVIWIAVWGVGLIGSVYALFGGLRTVAVSDTLNGVGLLVGGLLITYFGLTVIGDGQGAMAGLDTIRTDQADRLNSIGSSKQNVPFSTIFTGAFLLMTFYWCTNQQIIQRTFAARDLRTGQKGVLLCGAVKLLGPLYLVLPGLIAYQLYTTTDGITDLRPAQSYGRLVRDVLPAGLVGFFAAVVVGAILSSFNSALNSASTLFSLGVYKSRLRPDATERQVVASGKWFGWIIAAVAMTIAPFLVGQDSIFGFLQTMNAIYFIPILAVVVVGMLTRRVSAKAANIGLVAGLVLLLGGYFIPVGTKTAAQTTIVALDNKVAAELIDEMNGYTRMMDENPQKQLPKSIEILREFKTPPTLAERQEAEKAGKEAKPRTYIEFEIKEKASKYIAGDWMHTFHYIGCVFIAIVALMLAVGTIAPRPEPWEHRDVQAVDMKPWKLAVPVGITLVIAVIAIYAAFADFSVL